jgi:Kef-type K+ transport system membrane component KefB
VNSAVYFETAVIVLTAVVGGSIAHKLHRPMIVGYILGGVLIGLLVPRSPVMDVHTLERLAGIGAILLMFWAGIEFSFRAVLEAKWVAIICGLLAILLSIALSLAAGHEVMEEDSGQELLSALRSIELIRMKDTFNPRLEGRSGRCDEHFFHADTGQRERTTHGHG